tara:strand:+ start:657 stop:1328 length:672 start_codon:yes stop_codon:yes gene_type:complete
MKKIPCLVLARKNSKSIKKKNLRKLSGFTLIEITIKYLKKSKLISDIVVSTDDKHIAKISKKNKCFTIYPRPKELATDTATTESALKHALKIYENKYGKTNIVAYAQVTEPFRPKDIMDKCINTLIKNSKVDSCFASFKQKKNFWIMKNNFLKRISPYDERFKPRQIKKPTYREDTGIALATRSKFIRKGERIGKKVKCISYEDPKYNIDINNIEDLNLAKKF